MAKMPRKMEEKKAGRKGGKDDTKAEHKMAGRKGGEKEARKKK